MGGKVGRTRLVRNLRSVRVLYCCYRVLTQVVHDKGLLNGYCVYSSVQLVTY